jgi:glucosamine 6-phosphate synthetase-like amidotransferase/phosphosugar isomerase protein
MCGIFGILSDKEISLIDLKVLAAHSQQRGMDSSGLLFAESDGGYGMYRADTAVTKLLGRARLGKPVFVMGHSRLITNGLSDNQPVYRDSVCLIHNGIIVNHDSLWTRTQKQRKQKIDTEIIAAFISEDLESGIPVERVHERVLAQCKGIVACAVALPKLGKICLFFK